MLFILIYTCTVHAVHVLSWQGEAKRLPNSNLKRCLALDLCVVGLNPGWDTVIFHLIAHVMFGPD